MSRIGQSDFVRHLQHNAVDLSRVNQEAKERLREVGGSIGGISKADLNRDGKINGTEEAKALFDYVDRFDRNGTAQSIDTTLPNGAPTASGKVVSVLEMMLRPNSATNTAPVTPDTAPADANGPAPSLGEIAQGKVMAKGHKGAAVSELQDRLTQLGYGVAKTGEFGPTTEGVLKKFQTEHQVQPTGKLGQTTLSALQKAERTERPNFDALKGTVTGGHILREGDAGAAVVDLQRMLTKAGFGVQDTGKIGPTTVQKIKEFQAAKGVQPTGMIGPTTLEALQQSTGRSINGVLDVPFFPQTDNYTMPDRTCNSSACAMAAKYLGANISGDDQYLRTVLGYGDTTDHSAQTKALKQYGIESSFHYNLDFKDVDRALDAGKPVVIGINHRGPRSAPIGGHMITVIGKKGDDYIVNDPYGSLNDGYSSSVNNGKHAVYTRAELTDRWLVDGPNTGWGRIFS